jgi:hypothetical protein
MVMAGLDYDEFHQADDGDDDYVEYGEHTVENCIAFAEGRWIILDWQ